MSVSYPLAFIPSPSFSQFHIGPVTIHMYALTMLTGMILAVWILTHRWKKLGGTFDQVLDAALIGIPCGLVGARLFHVITVPYDYFPWLGGDLSNIWKVWQGGMAIFGALIGGFIGVALWAHHKGYSMWLLADALAPGLLVAQAVGRLGNWFNQELYGKPTTLPWGLKLNLSANAIGHSEQCYGGGSCPNGANTLFHPTFLYEIIWNLIGAALIVWVLSRIANKLRGGQIFACYLMWYGLGRTWIEQLRINLSSSFLGIRINTWVAIVAILIGMILFAVMQRYGKPRAELCAQLARVTAADKAREKEESTRTTQKHDKHEQHEQHHQAAAHETSKASDSSEKSEASAASQTTQPHSKSDDHTA